MARWRPGELDQVIDIRRESATDDGYGGQDITLSTLISTRAKVVPRSGREQFFSDQIESKADYMFVIRNRADVEIKEKDRILYNGEEYNIDYISRAGNRPLYLEVFAIRGIAQ